MRVPAPTFGMRSLMMPPPGCRVVAGVPTVISPRYPPDIVSQRDAAVEAVPSARRPAVSTAHLEKLNGLHSPLRTLEPARPGCSVRSASGGGI